MKCIKNILFFCIIQVLKFESHSHTSIPLLSQSYSFSLLEQLDSTQTDLAVMLLSRHVHPLRSDCAQWAGKLEHISEVLQVRIIYMYMYLHPYTCTCICIIYMYMYMYTCVNLFILKSNRYIITCIHLFVW